MTKRKLLYILAATVTLLFTSCNRQRNEADMALLKKADSLLSIHPEAATDSLKTFSNRKLSRFNRGYYQLLEVIALDKNYYNFTSDSLISTAEKKLSGYKGKDPHTYARSLMYLGLVRYRMGVTDSTAYQPLKEATEYFNNITNTDTRKEHLCNYYLGIIHDKNGNLSISNIYLQHALKTAKQLHDSNYLFNTYRDLVWNKLKTSDYKQANKYIDTLETIKHISTAKQYEYLNTYSSYLSEIKNYPKALEIDKTLLLQDLKDKDSTALLADYYKLSNNFCKLNKLDSAYANAIKAINYIVDTTNYANYFYYKNAADIALKINRFENSAKSYSKSIALLDILYEKKNNKIIFELEKKYDKSEAEKEALLYRNRNILTTTVAVFLMILLITLLIIWSQRHKQLHLKQLVNEQEKMALEKNNQLLKERQQRSQLEKQITDQQIMEQQFLLPLYEQITTRNTQIRKFLYDLTTDTHINKMPFLHEKIKNEFKLFDETVHSKNFESLTDDDFSKVTHLVEKELQLLNKSEKLLLSLLVMKVPHQQISVLLNTTPESLSSRKLKLKKKMELNDIKMD